MSDGVSIDGEGADHQRRGHLLEHLKESLTGGATVTPDSIAQLVTTESQDKPAVPASLIAEAIRSTPGDGVTPLGLRVEDLTITGDLDLSLLDFPHGLEFTNCGFTGSIDLVEASIGALRLYRCTMTCADREYSINARQLIVADSVVLPAEVARPINLAAVKIGGNLAGCPSLRGDLESSWVIDAIGLEVGGVISIGLPDSTWGGAVNLFGAVVAGGVRIAGVLRQPADGPALDMSWAEVGEDVDVHCRVEHIGRSGDVAFQIKHLKVKRDLTIRRLLTDASVDATGASVDGRFSTVQENSAPAGMLVLNGLRAGELNLGERAADLPRLGELNRLKTSDLSGWLGTKAKAAANWLDGASTFATQPWEEIAAVFVANGQPADARRMRYLAARRATHRSPIGTRLLRNVYWVTTGHGYYPMLALAWLMFAFLVALGLTHANHHRFTTPVTTAIAQSHSLPSTAPTSPSPPKPSGHTGRVTADQCEPRQWDTPCLNDIEYAISLTLSPVAGSPPWQPPSGWVQWLLLALRTLSWVFVALLLAGVTGLLRRE